MDGNGDDALFECEVELVTGHTHQIRAQFAAVGAPLLGDVLYGGASLRVGGEARASSSAPRALDEDDRLCLQSAAMTIDAADPTRSPTHETDGRTFEAGDRGGDAASDAVVMRARPFPFSFVVRDWNRYYFGMYYRSPPSPATERFSSATSPL